MLPGSEAHHELGGEDSFGAGHREPHLLAGLEVTTKAVERHAEGIGADIVQREQDRRDRVVQLEFPEILERLFHGCISKWMARNYPWWRPNCKVTPADPRDIRRAREKSNWVASSPKLLPTAGAVPLVTPLPRPTREPSKAPSCLADGFTSKPSTAAGIDPLKVVLGDGAETWNIADQHFVGAIQIVDVWHAREHI